MKLYRVLNGYQGFGEVKVFVVAPNEKRAIEESPRTLVTSVMS